MSFVNQNGDRFFAFQGTTKTGKPKYFASKKRSSDKGELVDELPDEFEFFESLASGVVTIRRRVVSRVTDDERLLMESLCRKLVLPECRVAIEKDSLVVYVALGGGNAMPELKFTLHSESERTFTPERFCHRGSIEDWVPLFTHGVSKLNPLAQDLLPHLGQDSFFELM